MTHIDLAFTLTTQHSIPADHGYALYGAISRLMPGVHRKNGIAVHPIHGRQIGDRKLMLMPWSTLTLRVPDGQIAPVLPLAGKSLQLGDATLHVGVPQVHGLVPTTALHSRLVVVKAVHIEPAFLLRRPLFDAITAEAVDIRPHQRHLVLDVYGDWLPVSGRFLCGHDEQHWFVASVPFSRETQSVRGAAETHLARNHRVSLTPTGVSLQGVLALSKNRN